MRVLVVSPHPDDETLGAGGTILKHKEMGDEIYWLIITNIDTENGWEKEIVERRQEEIKIVAEIYGFERTFKLDFPTTKLDIIPIRDLIKSISNVMLEIRPEVIYLPNLSDVHTDRQVTFKTVYSCTENFRYLFTKKILMYETLSETEFASASLESVFKPNVFVNITDYFEKKIKIMRLYESEIMNSPYPRSIETIKVLAQYRGSRIGKKYAEAFMLIYEEIV